MHINVNGQSLSIAQDSKLTDLINKLTLGGSRIAIELNREIVPRSSYETWILQDGDNVEIVQAIGGG